MRILIVENFLNQTLTGIQRTAIEITQELIAAYPQTFLLCREGSPVPDWIAEKNIIRIPPYPVIGHRSFQWVGLPLWLAINQKPDDYVVNFCNVGSPFIRNQLICIHDCSVNHQPAWFSRSFVFRYKTFQPLLAYFSAAVTTVSRFSKSEIHRYLPAARGKTVVIYNGVNAWWAERAAPNSTEPRRPYVLVVGSINPRKGLRVVLQAWQALSDAEVGDVCLYVAGGSFSVFSGAGLIAETNSASDRRVEFLGYVPDEQLRDYYREALCVINASEYEGFGLPILEAEVAGARILASDISAFCEVASPATQFFRSKDSGDLAHKLRRIVVTPTAPRSPARSLPAEFSWRRAAYTYRMICCSLANRDNAGVAVAVV